MLRTKKALLLNDDLCCNGETALLVIGSVFTFNRKDSAGFIITAARRRIRKVDNGIIIIFLV